MLAKRSRLSREEFGAAFKAARRVRFPGVQVLRANPRSPQNPFQASVVVGKKVSKLAVKRNYLRRRVYAHLRGLARAQSPSGAFVVIVLPEAKTMTVPALLESVSLGIGAFARTFPQTERSR